MEAKLSKNILKLPRYVRIHVDNRFCCGRCEDIYISSCSRETKKWRLSGDRLLESKNVIL